MISLDVLVGEQQFQLEPHWTGSADRLFDRRWALTLLETVQARLRNEYDEAGKGERYEQLEGYLPGERIETTYAQAGALLGMSEGAVKVEVHRMKKRFGRLLRDEIAHTVASETEIDDEIRHLMAAIS